MDVLYLFVQQLKYTEFQYIFRFLWPLADMVGVPSYFHALFEESCEDIRRVEALSKHFVDCRVLRKVVKILQMLSGVVQFPARVGKIY